jgi:hypothetical protein
MADYKKYYISDKGTTNPEEMQLLQLLRIVWDGDLMNKSAKNTLRESGFINCKNGYNIINEKGIEYLIKAKLISS